MKIPFNSLVSPFLFKNKQYINSVCLHFGFNIASIYVVVLGIVGIVLNLFDIFKICKCGPHLPGYFTNARLEYMKMIPSANERDFKLISLVLSAEYYTYIIFGVFTNNPIFFMPFLGLSAVIIFMQILQLLMKIILGEFNIGQKRLMMTALLIYNWLSVFCVFSGSIAYCDL